ncbi:MAG: GDP-L-fucose synthase family protein [Promethearchaeota archaeon]
MKILVTGATGMVGTAFKNSKSDHELIFVSSEEYNLIRFEDARRMFEETSPTGCIHLAARVGGVKANTEHVADFCADNLAINNNVLTAGHMCGIDKILSLLSTCVYPDKAIYPLTEDQIHKGPPHSSNFGYAYAKRMLDVQSRAYRQQYGRNYITAIPNNLFGECDNFHLENSHVIPAIIRKMHEAKLADTDVILWGDGSPLREFTYSKDLAEILLFLMEFYNKPEPINVGNTQEISIKEVAVIIADILEFEGEIIWDITKPKGQFRKPSDNSKLLGLGWQEENYTNFKKALTNVCQHVILKYPHLRGIK